MDQRFTPIFFAVVSYFGI